MIGLQDSLLTSEISALSSASATIDTSEAEIDGSSVNTLQTSMKYIEQHKKIAQLLEQCKRLITKDALDLTSMKNTVITLDSEISNVYHR